MNLLGRHSRISGLSTGSALTLLGLCLATAACSAEDLQFGDTPLGVTAPRIGYAPGQAVTGEVVNPDGTMTVTLAPAPATATDRSGRPATPAQDLADPATTRCDYVVDVHDYSCPTDGLAEGRYVVQVTDAAQPGEGTAVVPVAISATPGYDPTVGTAGSEEELRDSYVLGTARVPTTVPLAGWEPGSRVRLVVRADGGRRVFAGAVRVDASGSAQAVVDALPAGAYYSITVTDGLWVTTVSLSIEAAARP